MKKRTTYAESILEAYEYLLTNHKETQTKKLIGECIQEDCDEVA